MQRCPKCNRLYQDDRQKFCTQDGGRLVVDSSTGTVAFDPSTTRRDVFDYSARNNKEEAAPPPPPAHDAEATIISPSSAATPQPHTPLTTAEMRRTQTTRVKSSSPYSAATPPAQTTTLDQAPTHHAQEPVIAAASPAQEVVPTLRRKSWRPWLIGGGLALLLLLIAATLGLYIAYTRINAPSQVADDQANSHANLNANLATASVNPVANAAANVNSNDNATASVNANRETFGPPAGAQKFENDRAAVNEKLAAHYVDFSFYYPESWEKSEAGSASNFVAVERKLPPDFTQERFVVSWYDSSGTFEADRAAFPRLVAAFNTKFAKTYPQYSKVSEGPTTINGHEAYEFRFQAFSKGTEKGDITLWGRVIFLPPGKEGEKTGLTLLMLTTSLAPELTSIDDVGTKGELPLILDSFRIGQS